MNRLYYGDNLDVLRRHIDSESIDLVYLDPPFNSAQDYNVLFAEHDGTRAASQIKAFEDTWRWDESAARACMEMIEAGGKVSEVMQAFRTFLGDTDMMAYLAMMAPRLVELRRILKPSGSIFLHCDPTASHYLKVLMDAVFSGKCFVNEIVWHYRKWPAGKYTFQRNHDVILFYAKSREPGRVFNQLFMERAASTLKRFGKSRIVSGHDETGQRLPSVTADEDSEGVRMDDVWDIGRVPPIKQLFPTEKPPALLARIITAASNEGDVVLDPFCGCGTTVVVAHELKRRWIGIDITHLAITLIRSRLTDSFSARAKYQVIGEPVSLPDAASLAAADPYQFQWWALGLVGARPVEGKKGADKGIDGRIYFHEGDIAKTKQIILSVKAGHVTVSHLRDLLGVLDREKAEIGVLLCMEEPTAPMRKECASAGFYTSPWGKHARLQTLTVEDLLTGKTIDRPPAQTSVTFKRAPKAKPEVRETSRMPFGEPDDSN